MKQTNTGWNTKTMLMIASSSLSWPQLIHDGLLLTSTVCLWEFIWNKLITCSKVLGWKKKVGMKRWKSFSNLLREIEEKEEIISSFVIRVGCCKTRSAMATGCLSCTNRYPAEQGVTRDISLSFRGTEQGHQCRQIASGSSRATSKNKESYWHIQGSAFLGPSKWKFYFCQLPLPQGGSQNWDCSWSMKEKSCSSSNSRCAIEAQQLPKIRERRATKLSGIMI